jgi:competence protein ComEC
MLIALALAWMIGIALAHTLAPPLPLLGVGAAVGLLGALFSARRPQLQLVALCLLCAALGGLRYSSGLEGFGSGRVETLIGQGSISLVGEIAAEPRRSETSQRIVMRVAQAHLHGAPQAIEGRLLVVLPPYPAYRYGERLLVTGELEAPRSATRPGEFDYRAYLAHRGIHSLIREPTDVRLLDASGGNAILAALLDFREHCRQLLLRMFAEPHAALAIGILLGIQAGIPPDLASAFRVTGTSHILVVSGWNFTIVAALIGAVALRLKLGRWQALTLALSTMWAYAIFTGASAAVLRAAAMASLAVFAHSVERRSEPWRLLLGACWLISIVDPHTIFDLGFQLSALATGSLFAYAQPIDRQLARVPILRWGVLAPVREALNATFAAQILTLPLILYHFGNLSIITPLANVIIVPVVPYVMFLGAPALLAGLLWLPLGQLLALGTWLPLTWLANGALLLAMPRWASINLPPFPLWMLAACYILIGILHLLKHFTQRNVSLVRSEHAAS